MSHETTHIEFSYFKESGKWYGHGDLDLPGKLIFHIALEEVRALLEKGERPGLINGQEFHVLVTVYTEYGPLSWLYVRNTEGNLK